MKKKFNKLNKLTIIFTANLIFFLKFEPKSKKQ